MEQIKATGKKKFHWKARYSILTAIWCAWMVSFSDRMVMSISLPFIGKDLGLSTVMQGAVLSSFFAGYALFQIPGGILADKFGFRKMMTIGIGWWSIFTFLTGQMISYPLMLICRCLFGIGEGSFPGASWKCIATYFPLKKRGTATAIQSTVNTLGPAVASIVAAAIIATLGWRHVFMLLAIPGLIVALYFWVYAKDNPAEHNRMTADELSELQEDEVSEVNEDGTTITFKQFFTKPLLWQLVLIWFFFDITFWGFVSWLPSYLMKVRGFSLMTTGIVGAIPFVCGAIGTLAGGMLSDRMIGKRKYLYIPNAVIAGVFLYLTYTVPSANMAVVYQCIASFFMFLALAAFWGIVMDSIPPHIMGGCSSTVNFGGQVAGFVSPFIMGYLISASGESFDTAFVFLIAAILVSAVITMTVSKR